MCNSLSAERERGLDSRVGENDGGLCVSSALIEVSTVAWVGAGADEGSDAGAGNVTMAAGKSRKVWHFVTFWDISLVIVKLWWGEGASEIFSKVSHFVSFCHISLVIVKLSGGAIV